MSFKENLVRARSHIVLIVAILVSFAAVIAIERNSPAVTAAAAAPSVPIAPSIDLPALPGPRPLTDQEREWARIAWRYFVANTQPATGLANSVDNFPSTTMWDTASYLLAMISAERLGLIGSDEFDRRMSAALDALARIPLFNGQLPNKSYDTRSLEMVDYTNQKAAGGIGWSAIDIGRLEVPLNVLVRRYPRFTEAVDKVTRRWSTAALVRDGELTGAARSNDKIVLQQEGRLGYEQYAARTLMLSGADCAQAATWSSHLGFVDIFDVPVPTDTRDPARYGAQNYVLSEPYVLQGLEFGLDGVPQEFAWRLLKVQRARYAATGQVTAVTEDHLDRAPYFAYNTVYSAGTAWATVTDTGADASAFRSVSAKAAFAWYALYRNDYTARMIAFVRSANQTDKGWYAGIYEKSGQSNAVLNANTNGVILESLAYIEHGPMLRF
ncbi:hypothetical protein BLA23254_07477 [Burkholderia lata]|uniref:DUF3131 domain-containing protein n=1 Tax=Burkholderia lata (strain ATCC 17760 / DSM 23089 / LMG 22485 / NCIMB 9086 / R18194 / 383) TaxID=482957 RepID=A0A6P2SV63_BURL3|nr:DUF3131 domain-containing protein [Burkholderia lata]VWC47436.1 hypothetical protein BLA23254_07477 [Burkholderia lata]